MRFLLFLLIFSLKSLGQTNCEKRLKEWIKFHKNWTAGTAVLTSIPPITLFSFHRLHYHRIMVPKFERAYKLIKQAQYPKTNYKNAEELLNLVYSLKVYNKKIKKNHIKTVLKKWNLYNEGICSNKAESEYKRLLSREYIINMMLKSIKSEYGLGIDIAKDQEESSEELPTNNSSEDKI